jgi:hypothetical protein
VSLTDKLQRLGMQVYTRDGATFRSRLKPYYAKWKNEFGAKAWGLLEQHVGPLG